MKIELSTEQAIDICMKHEVLGGADTYKETRALVEYFEEIEEMDVLDLNLDPVALRCAFSIYTLNEAAETWDIDTIGASEGEERDCLILQYLRDRTTVIEVGETTVIVEEF
jgi:hypothetical protein